MEILCMENQAENRVREAIRILVIIKMIKSIIQRYNNGEKVGIVGYIGGRYGRCREVLNFQGILGSYVGRVGVWDLCSRKILK